MRVHAHMGERTHNPLPPMESHTRKERRQTTDKQQRTTNHIALPSRQVSSLIGTNVFNTDATANGAICLNIKLGLKVKREEVESSDSVKYPSNWDMSQSELPRFLRFSIIYGIFTCL